MILEVIKVIVLGIVEGITEWLPVSSTGHMILVDEFIHLNVSKEFMEMFLVLIQLGAILAVLVIFWKKIFPFSFKNGSIQIHMKTIRLWMKIVVCCIPAIIIGLPFNDAIDRIFYNYFVVACTLIIYGVLFIVIENRNKGKKVKINRLEDIDYRTALIIGIFQVLALIPGTSRSGATIVGGILIGVSRTVAAEFSFFLGIPTMFGASFLKLIKYGFHFSGPELLFLLLGMIVAFIVSMVSIRFLMDYVKKHDFKVFGWYRIGLGILVLGYFAVKSLFFK